MLHGVSCSILIYTELGTKDDLKALVRACGI